MTDLGCLRTPTSAEIPSRPISSVAFEALRRGRNQTPSMEWKIGPQFSAYTPQDVDSNYATLNRFTIGNVQLLYKSEIYDIIHIKVHLPLPVGKFVRPAAQAELSCLFRQETPQGVRPRKFIHWIFPIEPTTDTTAVTVPLKSWWTSNADAKPTVNSFEEMLPPKFTYIQWQDCFSMLNDTQSTAASLNTCYSTQPLYLTQPDLTFLVSKAYNYRSTDSVKKGVFSIASEPYTIVPSDTTLDNTDVDTRFAMWHYITAAAAKKTKQKKLAKCFAVNLDRDMDANGLINVDSTGDPLDPATVQELAGRGPSGTLNTVDLNTIEAQKAASNTTLFYIAIGLFGLIGFIVIVYLTWVFFPGRQLERDILQSAVRLKELSAGPGIPLSPTIPLAPEVAAATAAAVVAGAVGATGVATGAAAGVAGVGGLGPGGPPPPPPSPGV